MADEDEHSGDKKDGKIVDFEAEAAARGKAVGGGKYDTSDRPFAPPDAEPAWGVRVKSADNDQGPPRSLMERFELNAAVARAMERVQREDMGDEAYEEWKAEQETSHLQANEGYVVDRQAFLEQRLLLYTAINEACHTFADLRDLMTQSPIAENLKKAPKLEREISGKMPVRDQKNAWLWVRERASSLGLFDDHVKDQKGKKASYGLTRWYGDAHPPLVTPTEEEGFSAGFSGDTRLVFGVRPFNSFANTFYPIPKGESPDGDGFYNKLTEWLKHQSQPMTQGQLDLGAGNDKPDYQTLALYDAAIEKTQALAQCDAQIRQSAHLLQSILSRHQGAEKW